MFHPFEEVRPNNTILTQNLTINISDVGDQDYQPMIENDETFQDISDAVKEWMYNGKGGGRSKVENKFSMNLFTMS
ncbi:hypothetical protein GCK72_023042 [Caenorhabditis remanei]|uniref:Uncharacterized protein n=1 Tax=Caenorhabditis remanei TaxID=31234 RepID=A0A6A5FVP3_CAERE|nr:hypothetical protein GCK72_023042 [Caenorhabditis remanei]KAF1746585.1 hypothetical protein GCK72_023042 [Caenorhabditis remanei]